tara:strand:+ start:1491 stop:2030 length:540 start_codon:yes stop_codon:yes gene_type:complete
MLFRISNKLVDYKFFVIIINMYMKKVTTLLAAMAFAFVAFAGPATAATVAGVELTDWNVGATKKDGDLTFSLGATAPIALAGVEVDLKPVLGWNGDDVVLDLNVGYDIGEVYGATVSAVGGVGLNWIDTDDVGFDVRIGAGVSYPFAEGKAVFATYTFGYDFEASDNDTELRVGVSFKF